ncbi:MAG: DUF4350 domain-containing protein [Chloroflexi bacterium]|nr:DUF4350 domain-containing protein [Chloroflexota bacterium]
MRRLTDLQYLIIGLVGIVVVAYVAALANPGVPPGPLSARSEQRNGVLALRLWLEESGYVVRTYTDTVRLDDLDLLFVLNPPTPYTDVRAADVRKWIERGGQLILADASSRSRQLRSVLGIGFGGFSIDNTPNALTLPMLQSPTIERIPVRQYYEISTAPERAVVHLADESRAILLSFAVGSGLVWVSGTSYPFTNMGLQSGDSPALILNMLAGIPPGAVIGFDEVLQLENPPTLLAWLFNSPPGLGIMLSFALTMTFLALRGRRFGRAVPLPEDRLLRDPVEYIQAIANLYRRSGQRAVILAHYKAQLKRQLCERYGLRPTMSDDALIETIASRNPATDVAELRDLFRRLSAERVSEQELVSAALAMDAWLRENIG